jgi:endogenous inhibitor of DNA gyrase (YacG/DUF329 family)
MSEGEVDALVFVCPRCQESLEVNPPMMDALIERGCVICGSAVSEGAFSDS